MIIYHPTGNYPLFLYSKHLFTPPENVIYIKAISWEFWLYLKNHDQFLCNPAGYEARYGTQRNGNARSTKAWKKVTLKSWYCSIFCLRFRSYITYVCSKYTLAKHKLYEQSPNRAAKCYQNVHPSKVRVQVNFALLIICFCSN